MPYMLRQRLTTVGSLSAIPTWRYKLPSVGSYTAFELKVDCDRYQTRANSEVVYPLEQMIDKIELVEGGSRALVSLTGSQLDALNYWTFRRPNPRMYRQEGATGNQTSLFLMGGRDFYDTDYGYDLSRMAETYVEYSHSIDADAAEKFDASDHTVTLYGWRWMGTGVPTFRALLRARQIASWTTTGTAVLKTIPIPVGTPIRRIGIQAKTKDTSPGGTISKIELLVNNGEYSPATVTSPMHWMMQEVNDYALHNVLSGIDYTVGAEQTDVPRWWGYMDALQGNTYGAHTSEAVLSLGITMPARIQNQTTGNKETLFTYSGYGFQKCLRLGFDHDRNGADLLQTAGFGSLDLELTETAVSKDAAVFFEDILSY